MLILVGFASPMNFLYNKISKGQKEIVMKQEEWLAEFERVHGRPANQEEIEQVFGQFESPETQATQDTLVNPIQSPFEGATPSPEQAQFGGPTPTQAPFGGASSAPNQFQGATSPFQHQGQAFGQGGIQLQAPVQESAQAGAPFTSYNNAQMQGGYPNNGQLNYQTNSSYMGQAPIPGKKSKKGLIIGLCSLVAVAVLSVLAFFFFAKNPNSIQGKWSATPEVKKKMTSGFKESFTSTLDISGEFFKDVEMIVEVEGNNVKISTSGKVDFKGAAKKLLEGDKSYLNSVENALEYIEERSKWGYLKEIGVEIDVKKGTIDMVLFEGELSEKTHEFLVDSGGNFVMQYNLKYKLVNGILTVYQNEEDDFKFTFKK